MGVSSGSDLSAEESFIQYPKERFDLRVLGSPALDLVGSGRQFEDEVIPVCAVKFLESVNEHWQTRGAHDLADSEACRSDCCEEWVTTGRIDGEGMESLARASVALPKRFKGSGEKGRDIGAKGHRRETWCVVTGL